MEQLNAELADVLRELGFSVTTETIRTGLDGADLAVELPTSSSHDAALPVVVDHRATLSPVEVERWRSQHPATILGRDYVSPALAQRLRAAGVDYVDSVGNASVQRPGVHVHVEGRRRKTRAIHTAGLPARTPGPASLRVIFALLVRPDLAGGTFDELSEAAGVAKGTVHNTVRDLEGRGHLTGQRRSRQLVDPSRLADLWVDGFATQLLPRLATQTLAGPDPQWWAEHTPPDADIVLGGGLALAHHVGSLRPDRTVVYGATPWATARTLGRLTAQGHPNVILRERFWSPALLPDARFVPRLLAYAEALAAGDAREIEVARTLHDRGLLP